MKWIRKTSYITDPVGMRYVLAVIHVESRFNPSAVSDKQAYGLMQVTEVAALDAVLSCRLPVVPMSNLLDGPTNIRYGTCYLRQALEYTGGDWTRALVMYNGGYAQLTRYDNGSSIAKETAQYILQVQTVLSNCNQEE